MADDAAANFTGTEDAGIRSESQEGKKTAVFSRPGVRLVLLLALAVAAIALIAWLVHYQTRGKYVQSTNDAYLQADAVTVSPKISGYVEEVYVTDNQAVRAGQPLLRIDPRDYRAQAQEAQAQVDVAAANADNVRAMIEEQEATIAQSRAQLATARANARFSESEVARYTPLVASGAETGERLSTLRNQAQQSGNQVAESAAAVLAAERHIGSLRAQIRQAEAQGESARAQLASASVNVGSTIIRASVDGRIGNKTVLVGQFVQTGARMMSIVPVKALYITANFKETQIGLMRAGQPASIHVDALDGTDLQGRVQSFAPGTGAQFSLLPPQNATGNFTKIVQRIPVRISVDAGPEARKVLVPGLSATVEVDTIGAKRERDEVTKQEEARRQAAGK